MGIQVIARRLWAKLWLRRSQFTSDYRRLQALYAVKDPWDLSSPRERERFAKTAALIRQVAPGCGSLLELGCGEGFQTEYLAPLAQQVTGIDVSAQAIARAQMRCRNAQFMAGRAEDVAALLPGRRFDLVTAFEVLYYAKDVAGILAHLQSMTSQILVTNYSERARLMTDHFEGEGWTRLEDLTAGDTVWWVHLWKAPQRV